jgi:hypothetical protein
VDLSYLGRICATADFDKQIIYWAYPATGNTGGRCNKILCYNFSPNAKKRWSFIEGLDIEFLYTSLSEGYTLEGLDAISSSLDALSFSLDSRVWTGENYILSGFNNAHKQINFTGTAMDAVLETMELQAFPGNRANVSLIRPVVDGSATVTVQMGTRDTQGDSVSYANAVSVNQTGDCPVRSNARYHRVRVNISGDFNHAEGVDILRVTKAGQR